MKKSLVTYFLLFFILYGGVLIFFLSKESKETTEIQKGNLIVCVNELVQQAKDGSDIELDNTLSEFKEQLTEITDDSNQTTTYYLSMFLISIGVTCILLCLLYYKILRPFERLKQYAAELSKGNFEETLAIERTNFFGDFTWAFDQMRREIVKTRACEKQAIDNNKTVIATLSHDIKTPIASIRAYAEGLDAGLNQTIEKRHHYTEVILRKCDEVTTLTNDLFLHSISDLDKLVVTCERVSLRPHLEALIKELKGDFKAIHLLKQIPDVIVRVDKKRFDQVIENIIANSDKYANDSPIEIDSKVETSMLNLYFRDYGNGVKEEEIPFLFDKFYRGKGATEKPGAGLGLFIVRYVMEQFDGTAIAYNERPGFVVKLSLPIEDS